VLLEGLGQLRNRVTSSGIANGRKDDFQQYEYYIVECDPCCPAEVRRRFKGTYYLHLALLGDNAFLFASLTLQP
jgi:hypothetical protein